jgi:hypothetical protein
VYHSFYVMAACSAQGSNHNTLAVKIHLHVPHSASLGRTSGPSYVVSSFLYDCCWPDFSTTVLICILGKLAENQIAESLYISSPSRRLCDAVIRCPEYVYLRSYHNRANRYFGLGLVLKALPNINMEHASGGTSS